MNTNNHLPWRESYVFIADIETDYYVYSREFHPVSGVAVIVLNIIERMMEIEK